mmetsp:Transcript_17557/g.26503  ORF Transcript_17557/g.26503 Transcript_17557/m.26503 type:complete len:320 (-) Transcript_17557:106-1065(-)
MQQDGCVLYWGEPDGGHPDPAEEAAVGAGGEDLGLQVRAPGPAGVEEEPPPGVLLAVQAGEVVVVQGRGPLGEAPLQALGRAPLVQRGAHLLRAHVGAYPQVEARLRLRWDHVQGPGLAPVRGNPALQHGEVDGRHVPELLGLGVGAAAAVAQPGLLLAPEGQRLGADPHQLLQGRVWDEAGPVPRVPGRLHQQPPGQPFAVEHSVGGPRVGQPFVESERHRLHLLPAGALQELGHAVEAPDLLVGHEGQVQRPRGRVAFFLKFPDSFKVLHTYAFHILGAPCKNSALIITHCLKRVSFPFLLHNWNYIIVRVQNNGWK